MTELSLAVFAPLVGATFRAGGEGGVDLELVAVERLGTTDRSFALRFRGGPGTFLPQGTFGFVHPALGAFELFVSPTTRTADGFTTEAVFNLLPEL